MDDSPANITIEVNNIDWVNSWVLGKVYLLRGKEVMALPEKIIASKINVKLVTYYWLQIIKALLSNSSMLKLLILKAAENLRETLCQHVE